MFAIIEVFTGLVLMILNLYLLRSLIHLPLLDLEDFHLVPFKDQCSHKLWQFVEMCLRYTEIEKKKKTLPGWWLECLACARPNVQPLVPPNF